MFIKKSNTVRNCDIQQAVKMISSQALAILQMIWRDMNWLITMKLLFVRYYRYKSANKNYDYICEKSLI